MTVVVSPCTSTQSGCKRASAGGRWLKIAAADFGQALVGAHQIQIDVGMDVENFQHLVEHLPVLCGDAHQRFHPRRFRQGLYNRRHFYGFRTCAKDG